MTAAPPPPLAPATPAGRGAPSPLGLAQVVAAGVLWGTGGLAVHVVNDRVGMSAGTVSAYRMLLATLVLVVAVLALRQRGDVAHVLRHHRGRAIAVGVATAAYQGLYFSAVLAAGVGVATVVSLGLAPVMVTVVVCVRSRRTPRPGEVVALVAAVAGLLLVSFGGAHGGSGPAPLLGVGLAVVAAVGYAATTLVGARVSREVEPLALTTVATAVGALVLVPWGAVEALRGSPVVTDDPVTLLWLLWLGVATMALAYGLLYAGLRTTSSSTATVATLLEPVTAALLAAVVVGERIGLLGTVGGALILAAILVQVRSSPADEGPAAAQEPAAR
ncbi:DMT family transporter [Nocardioides zeae]|uniref:DMT family transporter n=1 Tax=Nocardioides imazamoxiresistens TaxID=3231893 RepID=A0ABU3PQP7_9ACTN|nr:DMT family transporter [Nocardioides zeae]MDT9591544.1 DMT family transporter [Nocardioides zeae]